MASFEDIFSSGKVKEEVFAPVVVDHREKNSSVAFFLLGKLKDVSFDQLEVGDFIIGDVVVERKTPSDLLSSLFDKRLFSQLSSLSRCEKKLLLLEGGSLADEGKQSRVDALVRSVMLDFQIPVFFSSCDRDSVKFILDVASKVAKRGVKSSLRVSKKFRSLRDQQLFVLEGFPGVGPSCSSEILDRFGSPSNFFSSSRDEMLSLRSLSEKRVDEIRLILGV